MTTLPKLELLIDGPDADRLERRGLRPYFENAVIDRMKSVLRESLTGGGQRHFVVQPALLRACVTSEMDKEERVVLNVNSLRLTATPLKIALSRCPVLRDASMWLSNPGSGAGTYGITSTRWTRLFDVPDALTSLATFRDRIGRAAPGIFVLSRSGIYTFYDVLKTGCAVRLAIQGGMLVVTSLMILPTLPATTETIH